jgi:tripartite-type tricarboxylate transporter receptor subunit TctC
LRRRCLAKWRWIRTIQVQQAFAIKTGDFNLRAPTLLLAAALTALSTAAAAQGWPSKALRFVVPFPPGGPLDAVARTLAEAASPPLGQAIVVDNRPGALGTIGAENVARAPADGYSVLLGFSGGHALTPSIMTLRFDPLKELPPLVGLAKSELVLVAGKKAKGHSLAEFIDSAKRKDNSVGGIGTGSTNHLVGELFKRATGIKGTHVPYQGAAPLALAVISEEVDFAVLDVGAILAHVQAGNMVALAVASTKRSQFLPGVPTMGEAGIAGVNLENVYAAFLPAGVPKDAQDKLASTLADALSSPAVRQQFARLGVTPSVITREEMESLIKGQAAALVPVATELKIRMN